MLRTEESKISLVILLTFALLLVTGVFPLYVLFTTIAFIIVLVGFVIYCYMAKREPGEVQDERSMKCSLAASRNGFMVAVTLIALLAAATSLGAPYSVITAAQIVWGLSIASYLLSYEYYKRIS